MLKSSFSKALSSAGPGRLHFAAHSHHPWPDATFEAQQQAWLDAARYLDDKWDHLFATVYPEAQRHVASALRLPDPGTLVFAPNTHELLLRILSCLGPGPRVVTSDAEFHSAERQLRRLEEEGLVQVERVPSEPFASFPARLVDAARAAPTDLVFFSHVFFNSGAQVDDLAGLVAALPPRPLVVIDGYHGFLAVPTDLSALHARAFYLAGGYKYAMAGEGACFLHVPDSDLRPRDTGWYAAFGALTGKRAGRVPYAAGGARFLGSTFDPSGLYRFNAAMRWRQEVGLSVEQSLAHVHALQRRFVAGLGGLLEGPTVHPERSRGAVGNSGTEVEQAGAPKRESPSTSLAVSGEPSPGGERQDFTLGELVVPIDDPLRGHFLTFRTPRAQAISTALKTLHVDTDARADRLRFGFGVYHDDADVDALLERVRSLR